MAQPDCETATLVANKITAAKERVSATLGQTHMAADGALHIVLQPIVPAPNPLEVKLEYCFRNIRDNFKKYNTKAKYHLNSQFIQPKAEQKIINDCFNKDEELKQLMKYLNITLNDFSQNLKRFMKGAENTDYNVDISPADGSSANVTIAVKNAKGRKIGPFLQTALYQDNHDGYTRLNVSVGYMSKHNKKITTHSLSYDSVYKPEDLVERRGDKEYLKTEQQVQHDKFKDVKVKKMHRDLRFKYGRW
ncbi:MAG: hypothetical protein IJS88_02115 [Alphaproteobacteria bacterium]|nr:hypothetical protein [Alphaproteobacteria bacterium]